MGDNDAMSDGIYDLPRRAELRWVGSTITLRPITDTLAFQSTIQINWEKYELIRNGVLANYHQDGEIKKTRLKVFDYENRRL